MGIYDLSTLLARNTYPGRGIVTGLSADGRRALIAYFIMGRSENSRNRVFEAFPGGMRTRAFDESRVSDPSLIIYNPFRTVGRVDIITNGDQTDTIYQEICTRGDDGYAFERALSTRAFEPDAPNYTPRISGLLRYGEKGSFSYQLSILRSGPDHKTCQRNCFSYEPVAGVGHFIHTYASDGSPLPSFRGDPEEVALPSTARELADLVWNHLNEDNKVSLFVRAVPLEGGEPQEIILNKNH